MLASSLYSVIPLGCWKEHFFHQLIYKGTSCWTLLFWCSLWLLVYVKYMLEFELYSAAGQQIGCWLNRKPPCCRLLCEIQAFCKSHLSLMFIKRVNPSQLNKNNEMDVNRFTWFGLVSYGIRPRVKMKLELDQLKLGHVSLVSCYEVMCPNLNKSSSN